MTDSARRIADDTALSSLAAAIEDLDLVRSSHQPEDVALTTICTRVVSAISDADAAGITVFRRGKPETVASTGPFVLTVDHAQYRHGEGPCIESSLTRELVRADLADAERRWPDFAADVADVDITSFLSAPITAGDTYVGALNLYSHSGHRFDSEDETAMRIYINAAQSVLTGVEQYGHANRQAQDYAAALESRAAIEQVKGALMLGLNVSADKAFDLLLWRSQQTNIKVRALCEQLISDIAALGDAPESLAGELGKLLMTVHDRVGSNG
ncbi:GAF and ANTAR domain-containing protein [Rhodococcus sp. MEB064]|uniref:GAF and ANTAR domain-containing protein n=1 Tax=Rhodococcus sp. MEB064 TaxID=1587522 RepID=UPI0006979204|nr:GAF and ANTAR domain-containing protein [Rhodococcus sp. MEB064]